MKIKCVECGKIEEESKIIKQQRGFVTSHFCSEKCIKKQEEKFKEWNFWAILFVVIVFIILAILIIPAFL